MSPRAVCLRFGHLWTSFGAWGWCLRCGESRCRGAS